MPSQIDTCECLRAPSPVPPCDESFDVNGGVPYTPLVTTRRLAWCLWAQWSYSPPRVSHEALLSCSVSLPQHEDSDATSTGLNPRKREDGLINGIRRTKAPRHVILYCI